MGKAILVISHDDRYFHLADRLIRMENGRLLFDPVKSPETNPDISQIDTCPHANL
jgi:putative ATP-binding cassette transporter